MRLESTLSEILLGNSYCVLGTTSNDRPWVTPVVYACDLDLNFYWASAHRARHSENLVNSPRASLAIYDSTQPQNNVQGVYAEGIAEALTGQELTRGAKLFYGWRYPQEALFRSKARGPEHFSGPAPRRIYRLIPEATHGLVPGGDPLFDGQIDLRTEVDLRSDFSARYKKKYPFLLGT